MSDITPAPTVEQVIDPQTGELVDPSTVPADADDNVDSIIAAPSTSVVAKSIPDEFAAAINSSLGQKIEAEIITGLPVWARGLVYGGIGGIATLAGGIVTYNLTYPGILPAWLFTSAGVAGAILTPIVASTAFANLGKK